MCGQKPTLMVEESGREIEVVNERGLHARASAKVVELAERYECDARISYAGEDADPRSIMELLTLGAACGSIVKLSASGTDAERFLDELETLFTDKFGEGR